MKELTLLLIVASASAVPASALPQASAASSDLAQARAARDRGDTGALARAVGHAHSDAQRTGKADAYIRVALLDQWTCEAAYDHEDSKLVKKAAQNGVAAAEKAVELSPDSSEAHSLLGDLLGQLIPVTFGGAMRYGPRATRELDKALSLDPKNAAALVSRAKAYFFTPSMFGGDKQKAVSLLKQAIEMDSSSDTADTAHIWLAQMYLDRKQLTNALQEAKEAKRLDPDRLAAQAVYTQVSYRQSN